MRTIKFRGQKQTNGVWVYGDLETKLNRIHKYDNDGNYAGYVNVDPDTIGQFTGLYDKNGKEIYEGDIIKHRELKVIVEFYRGAYGYGRIAAGEHVFVPFIGSDDNRYAIQFNDGTYFDTDFCEVIGNIHDNPNLLDNDTN